MSWLRRLLRRPLRYGIELPGPPAPRRCRNGNCELIIRHPLPHYHLTAIESGWDGWHAAAWETWPGQRADGTRPPGTPYETGWLRAWPGTMTAILEARQR